MAGLNSKDIILIDTPNTPEAAETLLEWKGGKFGPAGITAINTGFHIDNLGGNRADASMAEWPGAVEKLRRYETDYPIPGHGLEFGGEILDRTIQLLRSEVPDWHLSSP